MTARKLNCELPRVLSNLILIAIDDATEIFNTEGYELNMDTWYTREAKVIKEGKEMWHEPEYEKKFDPNNGEVCQVCLAGSVLVGTCNVESKPAFNKSIADDYGDSFFADEMKMEKHMTKDLLRKCRSLDAVRRGEIYEAYLELTGSSWNISNLPGAVLDQLKIIDRYADFCYDGPITTKKLFKAMIRDLKLTVKSLQIIDL